MPATHNFALDERGLIIPCPQCQKRNRVPYQHLEHTFRCGSCQAALPLPTKAIEVDSERAFDALTQRSALPVLVDFWASWCGPCQRMAPELDKFSARNAGHYLVAKVSTEEVPSLAQAYGVSAIPTLVLFGGGRELARRSGAMSSAALDEFVRQQAPVSHR